MAHYVYTLFLRFHQELWQFSQYNSGLQAGWAEEARDISQLCSIQTSSGAKISAKESLGYIELKKHKP
jgi:hypothetical protein